MSVFADLSIIIPVGPGEQAWKGLADDLVRLLKPFPGGGGPSGPRGLEVLLIATEPMHEEFSRFAETIRASGGSAEWLESPAGRARQLNEGARQATRKFLWFVHSDTRLSPEALAALERSLASNPDALIYFDLRFQGARRPRRMAINTLGVRIRSRWMGMPYGDQAFCLRKELFERLGRYPEDAPYGEDHLLVWSAHRRGVPLKCAGAAVTTSSRKYEERGWARVTFMTMYLGAKQALPQWLELRRERCGKGSKSKEVFG